MCLESSVSLGLLIDHLPVSFRLVFGEYPTRGTRINHAVSGFHDGLVWDLSLNAATATVCQAGAPSDKISRTVHRRSALVGALAVLTLGLAGTGGAHAAGLGRLNVQSALGQPLRAEVEVPSVGQDEAATLQLRLAPESAFRQANLEFNPALTQLRFDLEAHSDGTYVVHVSSAQSVNEPFLDLLLELSWSTGRVLREYTVLLDPPALKTAPEVLAPVVAQTQPAAPTALKPEPAQSPARPAAPEPQGGTSYKVKAGDTLGKIALENKPSSVSLDQMLVALLRANPNAFINNNMNLVLAGKSLSLPSESDARGIEPTDAHREVIAQSEDFNAYRSRIAQAAAAAPTLAPSVAKSAVQGKVVAKVEEKGALPKPGDQLKIARAEAAASAAAQSADETQARQRMLEEEQSRAEALKKTNEKLAKELEVVSKAAALADQQASGRGTARPVDDAETAIKAKVSAPSWAMNHWEWIAFVIVLPVLGFALKSHLKGRKAEPSFDDETGTTDLDFSTRLRHA